jgi:hypothetical protein
MKHLPFLFLFLFSFILSTAYAQLGQQAGPLIFNVTLGGSQTLNYSILNGGSSPINFTVILPILNTIPNNETPIVKVYPMNGTLAPHSQQTIHVTVFMPAKNKPGLTWNGGYSAGTSGIVVVEGAPSVANSGGMGAVVYAAVIKGIIIKSAKPPINILLIVGIVLLAAIIVAGGTLYYYYRKRAVAKAKKELRAKELAELKARARGKARKAVKKKARARPKAKAKARKAKARRRAR